MTMLPIDARTVPYKDKYLTEETPVLNRWMIFGESLDGKLVDINDGQQDIFIHVQRDHAERIIKARDAFCNVIEELYALSCNPRSDAE